MGSIDMTIENEGFHSVLEEWLYVLETQTFNMDVEYGEDLSMVSWRIWQMSF